MKINNLSSTENIVNQKARDQVEKNGRQQQEQGRVKNGNVKAADLNLFQDPIEEKKKKAMEEAMDFIKKQFSSDGMVDDILGEFREDINKNKALAEEASQELAEVNKEKDELKEMYTNEEDPEYKARLSELNAVASEWKKQYNEAHRAISATTQGIKSIKQEALKHHGMEDATEAAEKSLKASSDEIVGMLKDEAIDKIDEDLEEVVEEAKETKEENVKAEAEREKIRAEREKQAQKVEEKVEEEKQRAKNHVDPPSADELLQAQEEIARNTERILDEQKLLIEDIKGIAVDMVL